MKRIQSASITEQVYEILRQEIIGRKLAPNSKLDVNALADEIGVSRTPVVDALSRLETEGLIIRRNRVGTFVAPLDHALFEETFQARHMVEQFVTPLSIERLTGSAIADLENILQLAGDLLHEAHSEDSFDYQRFTHHDQDFHIQLVELCGNQHIIDYYRSLNAHMQIARVYARRALARTTEGHAEHQHILEAFITRDVEAARKAQAEHLQRSRNGILAMLEKYEIL